MGEKLEDKDYKRTVKALLRRQGLITREVVERIIYIGLPELEFFGKHQAPNGHYLAEGSLRAILEDADPRSPSREIRRLVDEGLDGLAGIQIAFNDLGRIAGENRLEQIQGIGPQRRQFLESFISTAKGEGDFSGLSQPLA